MNEEIDSQLFLLMGQYMEGAINESDAVKLLTALRTDANLCQILSRAVVADLLLWEIAKWDGESSETYIDELYRQIPEAMLCGRSMNPAKSGNDSADLKDSVWITDWDELVRIQNAEKPFSQMSSQEIAEYRKSIAAFHCANELPFPPLRRKKQTQEHRIVHTTEKKITPNKAQKPQTKFWTFSNVAFAASLGLAVLLVLCITWQNSWNHSADPLDQKTSSVSMLATIVELVDPEWSPGTIPCLRGQQVGSGEIAIDSGMIKLITKNNVELIFNGPGRLSILDQTNVWCDQGQLSATIPPAANGFTVKTPFGKVVDLGTEFFIDVDQARLEVETAKGKVEIVNSASEALLLPVGSGVHLSKIEKKNFQFTQSRFVPKEHFRIKLKEYVTKELQRMMDRNKTIDSNPNLLVRFDFTQGSAKTIPNKSQSNQLLCPSLKLHNTITTDGPLYGTKSVYFGNTGAGIPQWKGNPEEKYDVLTFSATVRVKKQTQTQRVLIKSRDFPHAMGSISWELAYNGESSIYFVRQPVIQPINYFAPPLPRTMFGAWITLDVTMDSERKKITHYINGKRVGVVNWTDAVPIQLQKMVLGSSFDGDISEFKIYRGYPK